jgi:MFS superfamily sulfate permease-like transporter
MGQTSPFSLKHDLPSAIVVFFIALPLCTGIALASGATMFSGILSGILGAVIAGSLSKSPVAITGPAAGISAFLLFIIKDVGTFQALLVAIVLSGILQIIYGSLKLGVIGHFFPYAVIKGMIAGIGTILVLKQIPHALGDDADYVGDVSFFQNDKQNTFTEIVRAISNISPVAFAIAASCLLLILVLSGNRFKSIKWLLFLPTPLLAVLLGIFINSLAGTYFPELALSGDHLVKVPKIHELASVFTFPDWSILSSRNIYMWAIVLSIVTSIETLLAIEAAHKMDPYRRITPLNHEITIQGITNVACGMLGALPVTTVIVRTSANINSGAKSKLSAILHGLILAASILFFANFMERIPIASFSAILILLGYNLTRIEIWRENYAKGIDQFIPFAITVIGIVFTNLFIGIFIGILVSVFFVLKSNFQSSMLMVNKENNYLIKFTKDVSFFNKSTLVKKLESIPNNSTLLLEGSVVKFIDHDIIELLNDYQKNAVLKNIAVEVKKTQHALHPFFKP